MCYTQRRWAKITTSLVGRQHAAGRHLHYMLIAELDAGILDHLGPLRRFFPDDRGKFGRRTADRLEAKFVELLAYLRQRQRLDRLAIQLFDDILWRGRRGDQ